MRNSTATIQRAAKLLEDAIRLVISLRVARNSNPLKVVVLDKLEADLKDLEAVLKEELQRNLLDEVKSWSLLNALFKKVSNYLYKSLINTLLCKYFLLRQKLIYRSKMKIGKTLKLIRILKGLKQKELADKLGISPNYLSSVENDKREPSLSFIKLVSKELDVPVSFLFLDNIDEEAMSEEQKVIYQKLKNLLVEFQSLRVNNPNGKVT